MSLGELWRHRWENNIRKHIREVGIRHENCRIQDGIEWQTFPTATMSLRVPWTKDLVEILHWNFYMNLSEWNYFYGSNKSFSMEFLLGASTFKDLLAAVVSQFYQELQFFSLYFIRHLHMKVLKLKHWQQSNCLVSILVVTLYLLFYCLPTCEFCWLS